MTFKDAKIEFGNIIERKILEQAIEQCKADGCSGCAYMSVEEWEMPCVRCARNYKDYWRKADMRGNDV